MLTNEYLKLIDLFKEMNIFKNQINYPYLKFDFNKDIGKNIIQFKKD